MAASARLQIPQGDDYHSKAAWRKAFSHLVASIPADSINSQSARALQLLRSSPIYQSAESISVFLSMPAGELLTNGLVLDALSSGKHVFVPYITRNPVEMNMMRLDDEQDFRSLRSDKWGIPSLSKDSVGTRLNCFGYKGVEDRLDPVSGGLDVILLPAVAFDGNFDRLGHGRGYYDKFLKRYIEKARDGSLRKPYLIGLALQEQLLESPHSLPTESWDRKVDAIIADGRVRTRIPPGAES